MDNGDEPIALTDNYALEDYHGFTKREKGAFMLLAGMLANSSYRFSDDLEEIAVEKADHLLKELDK